jgi:hypothetical protein
MRVNNAREWTEYAYPGAVSVDMEQVRSHTEQLSSSKTVREEVSQVVSRAELRRRYDAATWRPPHVPSAVFEPVPVFRRRLRCWG